MSEAFHLPLGGHLPERRDQVAGDKKVRDAWGIENGLHQSLDISHNDDRCRVRNDNAMLVLGMLRLSNSPFMMAPIILRQIRKRPRGSGSVVVAAPYDGT